ncbi:chalcone isomerase family protein [Hydrogenophaga sp.]|uniref:chalcone isomerase family protein n=1 Tax=Hydrogenophaga sp. TaxID=1904254 RepID=UPI0025BF1308|nr:chalcone isomerase family protein [Hydrogenophaga sp.]
MTRARTTFIVARPAAPFTALAAASLLALAALALALPARANTPEPVLTEALQGKQVVGNARLRVWGFEVYDARLFASPGFDSTQFGQQPFALELQYLRNFKGAEIAKRSIDEMRDLETIAPDLATQWQAAMRALFPDVKKGDRITGVHTPGRGAAFYLNDRLLGEVADDRFSRLFFGIWLSPKTSQPAMRETLLQRVSARAP